MFRLFKSSDFYLGGTQINESDYDYWTNCLKENGFNTVSLTDYAIQARWNTAELRNPGLNNGVITEIKNAKKNGLKVVLILRIALDHIHPENDFLWHGMIMPENDSLISTWFEKYREFVRMWALKAEKLNVDILGIGSELKELVATEPINLKDLKDIYYSFRDWQYKSNALILKHKAELQQKHIWNRRKDNFNSLEIFLDQKAEANVNWCKLQCPDSSSNTLNQINKRRKVLEKHWRILISETRQLYSGKLTYAANFDNYTQIAFWDALDLIGINAYFKLRDLDNNLSKEQEIYHSWNKELNRIKQFKQAINCEEKPILFTELGFTYRENSTIYPWAYDNFSVIEYGDTSKLLVWYEQEKNYIERALAINQLARALNNFKAGFLKGVLYWKLTTDFSHEKYEEFMLWIGKGTNDPAIEALKQLKSIKGKK